MWFSEDDISIHTFITYKNQQYKTNKEAVYSVHLSDSLSRTLAHTFSIYKNLHFKTKQRVVYYVALRGLVRRTLAYIHLSHMKTNNIKQTKKWFTLFT